MVKKVAKNDHFTGLWHKMAQKPISGRRGLTKLSADGVKELLYKLVKSDWRWYFWVLRSEWSKKWEKMIILRGGGIKWRKKGISGTSGLTNLSADGV